MSTITKLTPTEDVLQRMFIEDTGISLMDSGGTDGRKWQQNANMSFVTQAGGYVEYGEFRISLYRYLLDRLTYSEFQTDQFNQVMGHVAITGMNEMLEFVEDYHLKSEGIVYNSFNDDTLLDQQVQWLEYSVLDQTYVMLQLHNGADARGGYTEPKIFKADPAWYMQACDIDFECERCNTNGWKHGPDSEVFTKWGHDYNPSKPYSLDDCLCPKCGHALSAYAPDPDCY